MISAELTKTVVRLTAATGVSTIVSNAAKAAMPLYPKNTAGFVGALKTARVAGQRIGVIVASGVLGGLVADHAMDYSDKKVDEVFDGINKGAEFAAKFVQEDDK